MPNKRGVGRPPLATGKQFGKIAPTIWNSRPNQDGLNLEFVSIQQPPKKAGWTIFTVETVEAE